MYAHTLVGWTMAFLLAGLAMVGAVQAQTVIVQGTQVDIHGPLPRDGSGAINTVQIRETVAQHFAQGVREVQFRGTGLTEAEAHSLFLAVDRNHNLLSQIGTSMPADGVERNVTFRGTAIGDVRVQRDDDRTLRLRAQSVDLRRLSEAERQELIRKLSQQAGFDRVRLAGLEFRSDKGLLRAASGGGNSRGDGGSDNSGRGSFNSGSGSTNSGPGSGHGGRGREGGIAVDDGDRRLTQTGDIRREDRQADRRADRREDRSAPSGLDRADEVTGAHGQQGRQNAREHVGVNHSERPNRIERVERFQRLDRPERVDRAGRG